MTSKDDVRKALEELRGFAERYHRFQERPEGFLESISRFDEEKLRRSLADLERITTRVVDGVEQISPVVFLRRVIIERMLLGTKVELRDLEEIKERIDQRDVAYFQEYAQYQNAIRSQRTRQRSAFANWTSFRLLFYIDYRFISDTVSALQKEVADFLQSELKLQDCEYHLAGFNYNQNFGIDDCWIALYPSHLSSHQEAHQIFLGVEHDKYTFGIVPGGRVSRGTRLTVSLARGELEIDRLLRSLSGRKTKFYELNLPSPGNDGNQNSIHLPLNTILYGPPGTGKTYSVQKRAVEIIDGDVEGRSDTQIGERFRTLLREGRVEFVTFHPSYSYEEFVEGFRFDPDEKIPVLRQGTFTRLARRAIDPAQRASKTEARVWKISLGDRTEQWVFDRCIEKNEIAIGWFDDYELTGLDREGVQGVFQQSGKGGETNNIRSVNYFLNEVAEGDYISVFKDQRNIRAIGIVEGPYRYEPDYAGYRHVRSVRWMDKGVHDIFELNANRYIGMPTLYPLNHLDFSGFIGLLPKKTDKPQRFVLVIDEINRGNIPKIFGELITLIEDDKRQGAENQLEVRLPYSQQAFSVPQNLYIIGTMNTADRSIALIDIALRRRFHFEEIMPSVDLIRSNLHEQVDSNSDVELSPELISLVCQVFQILNRRITVLLDRDHQLGHSYFMKIKSVSDLHTVLYERVFPLLQEYFYNDRDRLIRLLGAFNPAEGNGFVQTLSSEYTGVFEETELETDEIPWEFHRYKVGELEDALKKTFRKAEF